MNCGYAVAMDKSKQICPQHLDNSGELSTYQQEAVLFLTNFEGGTHIGGRALSWPPKLVISRGGFGIIKKAKSMPAAKKNGELQVVGNHICALLRHRGRRRERWLMLSDDFPPVKERLTLP
jgi:hypothetical protein